jgi:hypothetical protein
MNVPVYLNETEVSALIRVAIMSLRRWRREGKGPPFRKLGSRVVYSRDEVIGWAEAQARTSTTTGAEARP